MDERGQGKAPNPSVDEVPCLLPTRWWFASTAFPLLAVSPYHFRCLDGSRLAEDDCG